LRESTMWETLMKAKVIKAARWVLYGLASAFGFIIDKLGMALVDLSDWLAKHVTKP